MGLGLRLDVANLAGVAAVAQPQSARRVGAAHCASREVAPCEARIVGRPQTASLVRVRVRVGVRVRARVRIIATNPNHCWMQAASLAVLCARPAQSGQSHTFARVGAHAVDALAGAVVVHRDGGRARSRCGSEGR